MTPDEEATRLKRSQAAKRASKKRAATKKRALAARRKEARETPLVLADLDKLRSAVSELTGRVNAIDHRLGGVHLQVTRLVGHCLINPASSLALAAELLSRLPPHELEKLRPFFIRAGER